MRINLLFIQESFQRSSFEVSDDELFYPDCNMSKIMRIENGKVKIKREWKKVKGCKYITYVI